MRDETAHLRDCLDERGIFWIDIPRSDRKRTCWKSTDDQDGYCYFDEDIFGVTELMVTGISAEEVIDATLGPRTCRNDAKPMAQQENDRLKAENEKLISVLHEVEAEAVDAYLGLRHDCELLAGELYDRFRKCWHEEVQNAKLRQLVRHMYECMGNIDPDGNHECDSCEYDNEEGKCDYERQMRELGIEVDG